MFLSLFFFVFISILLLIVASVSRIINDMNWIMEVPSSGLMR